MESTLVMRLIHIVCVKEVCHRVFAGSKNFT